MLKTLKEKYYQNTTIRDRKADRFVLILYMINFGLSTLFVFMHEWGHMVVAAIFGINTEEFVVEYDYGYVRISMDVIHIPPILMMLIGLSGGMMTVIVILLIAQIVRKELWILSMLFFPYGVWEGGKGLLFGLGVPWRILGPYLEAQIPVSFFGIVLFAVLILVQIRRIENISETNWIHCEDNGLEELVCPMYNECGAQRYENCYLSKDRLMRLIE